MAWYGGCRFEAGALLPRGCRLLLREAAGRYGCGSPQLMDGRRQQWCSAEMHPEGGNAGILHGSWGMEKHVSRKIPAVSTAPEMNDAAFSIRCLLHASGCPACGEKPGCGRSQLADPAGRYAQLLCRTDRGVFP